MTAARTITSNEELQQLHRSGSGYIYNSFGRVLHKSDCDYVESMTVGTYKLFFATLEDARSRFGGDVNPCPHCLPLSAAKAPSGMALGSQDRTERRRAEFQGPGDIRGVYAWLDTWLPFDNLDDDQKRIRTELRSRISRLRRRPGEILHASYAGPRHPASDVENLLLYNIDMDGGSFAEVAAEGLCIELAAEPLREPPSGNELPCAYAYRLLPAEREFTHWQIQRELARWKPIEVPTLSGPKMLEAVWWALSGAAIDLAGPERAADAPCAVTVAMQPPVGVRHTAAALVKGVFDGVVCALQSHGDKSTAAELAPRLARVIPGSARQIEARLVDDRQAVLGSPARLIHKRGAGVQWAPSDHLLVAGKLVVLPPRGDQWRLGGTVSEATATAG